MLQMLIFSLGFMILGVSSAAELSTESIFKQGLEQVSLQEALKSVQAGQVVVLGEAHGTSVMASQQMQVLKTLKEMGRSVSVGMEFFAYPYQPQVDLYRQGDLAEAEFLNSVEWGQGFSFEFYKSQVLFPEWGSEFVLALNAPRSLTSKIAKVGVEGLNSEELALLPPDFEIGNEAYFRRFKEVMSGGGHVPAEEALQRYFAAQSAWDDTMAWRAAEFLKQHPEQVLVIIVGEFHVQYGGGLPDRLSQRGLKATTFSLVNLHGLTSEQQAFEVQPSATDGARADFVWTSSFPFEH